MKKILLSIFLICLISSAFAQTRDERFGYATAFHNWAGSDPEYNPQTIPNDIAGQTPAAYVRSDIGWIDGETSPGVYVNGTGVRTQDQTWIDACTAQGLGVVLVLNQYYTPLFYPQPGNWFPDSSGTAPSARYAANLAKTELARGVKLVIEVFNEPNNSHQSFGTNWPADCAAATKIIADAVHAVTTDSNGNHLVPVIGLGAQGADVIAMEGMGTDVDGVVYHCDSGGSESAEYSWENTSLGNNQDYRQWVGMVQAAAPGLPIWVTEASQNAGDTEYKSAVWIAHRLFLDAWMGVSHTFLYQYIASDTSQSSRDYYGSPRWNRAEINRIYSLLAPDSWRPGEPLVPDNNPVIVSSTASGFNPANFVGLDFRIPGIYGRPPPTSMVFVAVGYGTDLNDPTVYPVQLTVVHPNAGTVLATNVVTGKQWYLSPGSDWYQSGNNVVITNAQAGQEPIVYKIWNGAVSALN